MAKSGRHKKIRKQEKAKTQLKSGIRKLDKPQNIIDPKLRVKKILLREQLKDNVEGEVATKRHQSLQDILTSLNHHNTNIKKDGLSGLQEIISSSVETLYDNLDRILEKIAGLTADIEDSVRRDNLRVAEIIFAQVSEDQVKPFWNLILAHIKCTLSNLNPIIRYGCLSFMALLVSYFPNLVSHSIHILLPNILGLISSSVVATVSAKSATPALTPTTSPGLDKKNKLKIEISGKHNDAKERLRVLRLISACLDLYTKKKEGPSSTTTNSKDNETVSVIWKDNSSHLGLYSPYGYAETQSVCPYYGPEGLRSIINTTLRVNPVGADTIFQGEGNRSGSSSDDRQSEPFWPQFLKSCLPLLFETWLEIRPSTDEDKRGKLESAATRGVNNLPKGTVEILDCIVTVMTRLFIQGNFLGINSWNSQSQSGEDDGDSSPSLIRQLRKTQGQELKKYFFDALPFSAINDSQKKTVTSVNLQLFSIAAQLRLVDKPLMLRLQHYLQVLTSMSALDSAQTSQVLEILSFIHLSNVGTLTSGILSYALDSGHYEAVNGFLGRTLTLGQDSAEQNLMLKTIDWDEIVPKIFERVTSVTPTLLTVLTFIALRNLTDLKPVLQSNLEKFEVYLETDNSLEAWDQVARLFYFCECLKSMKSFNVTIPEPVLQTFDVLTA